MRPPASRFLFHQNQMSRSEFCRLVGQCVWVEQDQPYIHWWFGVVVVGCWAILFIFTLELSPSVEIVTVCQGCDCAYTYGSSELLHVAIHFEFQMKLHSCSITVLHSSRTIDIIYLLVLHVILSRAVVVQTRILICTFSESLITQDLVVTLQAVILFRLGLCGF